MTEKPELYQCDCCGKMFPPEQLHTYRHDQCSAGVDTTACPKCRGWADDDDEDGDE